MSVRTADKPAMEYVGPFLMSRDFATDIRELLPLEFRFSEFRFMFSPKVHGISIPSFYRHVEELPFASVLIVRDAKGCCTFGAFCKKPWLLGSSRQYFGSSENFLFSLIKSRVPQLRVFGCSSSGNRLYQFCDDKRIVVGGGGAGGAGICIFENWLRGSSGPCETYGTTESLCCSSEFVVGDIEFWALMPDTDATRKCTKGTPLESLSGAASVE